MIADNLLKDVYFLPYSLLAEMLFFCDIRHKALIMRLTVCAPIIFESVQKY
jgi:hypothetical protein